MLRMEKQLRGNPTALLPIQSILAMPGAVSASLEGASHPTASLPIQGIPGDAVTGRTSPARAR